jgi:predicted dehydrogenase
MNILVVGCGSIGKRHIRNLISLNTESVSACDIDEQKRIDAEREFNIKTYRNLSDALDRYSADAVFICTPPSLHVAQAKQCLLKNAHCFIEKPLSDNLSEIDEIITLSKNRRKTVMLGYTLRFSASLRKIMDMIEHGQIGKVLFLRASVGYYLPYWRPHEDYREGYGSKLELGGGIVLDASHEIDYVRYLLGEVKEVFAVCRKLSRLEIETEDFAEITLHFEEGAYAQIHLDYLQSNYRRSCEIVGETGMLLWDINERTIKQYSLDDKEYHTYYEGLNANINDMYLEEIKHFFACIEDHREPLISLKEGKRVQQILMKIKESSDSGSMLPV